MSYNRDMLNKPLDIKKTDKYETWFNKLRDTTAKAKIEIRVTRLSIGNPGNHKDFGDISELRLDYGPGYRVYYTLRGKEIILLLFGGDKGCQSRDIEQARKLLLEYEEQEKRK